MEEGERAADVAPVALHPRASVVGGDGGEWVRMSSAGAG